MCSSAIWYACKQWAFASHIPLMSLKQSSGGSWAVSYDLSSLLRGLSSSRHKTFLCLPSGVMTETQDGHLKTCYFHTRGPKVLGEFDRCLLGLFMKSDFASSVRQSRICHSLKLLTGSVQMKTLYCFHSFFLRPFSCLLAAGSTKGPVSTAVLKEIQCFQMLQLLNCGTGCLWEHPSLWSSKPHFSLSWQCCLVFNMPL